jgi:hypothetical protein
MKKINLKGLMETLSEKEMKAVMAGSGGSDPCKDAACDRNQTCTNVYGNQAHCMANLSGYCKCGTT